jgi:hypothetical protein
MKRHRDDFLRVVCESRAQIERDAEAQAEELAAQWDSRGAVKAASKKDGLTELETFWLRKTRKPVLSVLLVRKRGDPRVKLYRGVNMEVSMPTGSLCAERNVIGTALAADFTLQRDGLRMIAGAVHRTLLHRTLLHHALLHHALLHHALPHPTRHIPHTIHSPVMLQY